MTEQKKQTSWSWYLLPVLFSIIGGIVGYFLLKNKDKENAKGLIWIGVIQLIVEILTYYYYTLG